MRTASVLVVVREHVRLIFVLFFEKEPFAGTHTHLKWSLSFGFFFFAEIDRDCWKENPCKHALVKSGLERNKFYSRKTSSQQEFHHFSSVRPLANDVDVDHVVSHLRVCRVGGPRLVVARYVCGDRSPPSP